MKMGRHCCYGLMTGSGSKRHGGWRLKFIVIIFCILKNDDSSNVICSSDFFFFFTKFNFFINWRIREGGRI